MSYPLPSSHIYFTLLNFFKLFLFRICLFDITYDHLTFRILLRHFHLPSCKLQKHKILPTFALRLSTPATVTLTDNSPGLATFRHLIVGVTCHGDSVSNVIPSAPGVHVLPNAEATACHTNYNITSRSGASNLHHLNYSITSRSGASHLHYLNYSITSRSGASHLHQSEYNITSRSAASNLHYPTATT